MKHTHRKRLPCGVCVGGSIALRKYPHRRDYVRDLVMRLDHVPQILPLAYRAQARTRGAHSRNMVQILNQVAFPAHQQHVRRALSFAAMVHDIGHAMHGHASERAINAWAGRACFSNDQHSARLIYHVAGVHDEVAPVYGTPSLAPLSDITLITGGASCARGVKSQVLEFLDDLENALGDAGDLVRTEMASADSFEREQGFSPRFALSETPAVAIAWLRKIGFDGTYASLCVLSQSGSSARQLLDAIRQKVDLARLDSKVINVADELAASAMDEMCQHIAYENPDRDTQWVIDVVTTADLEYVP